MHILVVGAGNPIPTFIDRRLQGLRNQGIRLTITLEANQRWKAPRGSEIIYFYKPGNISFAALLSHVVLLIRHPLNFQKLLQAKKQYSFSERVRWALRMLPLTLAQRPDLIHFQWLSFAHDFQWLRIFYNCPVVASARGSQATVYPFTRHGYEVTVRKAIGAADYIHCVSRDIARKCASLGSSEGKLYINYNGIDTDVFKPDDSLRPETFEMISIGTLIWRKGYIYQLMLVRDLLNNGCRTNLTIIGDGPDKEGLVYTALLLGVEKNVCFAGRKSAGEIIEMLNRSEVYLTTSAAEGLANSVVEAVACGLPVVGFACEGISEIVLESENGFIVPFGDVKSMRDKLTTLINSPELKKKFSAKSREIALKNFQAKEWTRKMIEFYESICGKNA